MASIKVQKSRFALLKIEDDDSDDGHKRESESAKKNASQLNAQKKKNKKKKQQNQTERDELKHLAFGAPNKSHSGHEHHQVNGSSVPTKQWDEWQKLDEEYAADAFEKDLQQALLLSKLESEQQKQQQRNGTDKAKGDGETKENKKKKKKEKHAMSLEEFNKKTEEKKVNLDELDTPPSLVTTPKVPPSTTSDTAFFESVESDVSRILRQEKMQEEYKKQYAAESVITAKYQEQIRKLEKEVEFLRATMKKQEEELKQVKKRNKQLCVILAQGEMKDKAEVLMQVDQLTEVKDELTEQVSELTAELEKERSKVHTIKSELDKFKGSKHK